MLNEEAMKVMHYGNTIWTVMHLVDDVRWQWCIKIVSEFQHSLKEADRIMELDVSLLVSTSSQGEKSTYPHRHAKDD